LPFDEVIPWPKLPTMGVAGELQIKTSLQGRRGAAGLMRQQQPEYG
jgi:hypothetical protein